MNVLQHMPSKIAESFAESSKAQRLPAIGLLDLRGTGAHSDAQDLPGTRRPGRQPQHGAHGQGPAGKAKAAELAGPCGASPRQTCERIFIDSTLPCLFQTIS